MVVRADVSDEHGPIGAATDPPRLDQPALAAQTATAHARPQRRRQPIVPLVNGRILARRIPDARLHVVRGGGHLFLLERPAETADLVTQFLHGKMRIG